MSSFVVMFTTFFKGVLNSINLLFIHYLLAQSLTESVGVSVALTLTVSVSQSQSASRSAL